MSLEQVLKDAVAPLERALDVSPLESQVTRLTQQIGRIQTLGQAVSSAASMNTHNVVTQVVQTVNPAVGSGGRFGGSLLGGLGLATGISPLIHGLFSLFGGGGGSQQAPAFIPFALPQSVNVQAGVGSAAPGSIFAVEQGQGSVPRAVQQVQPQVTIQVQALDSQSILDRSGDIAAAVRQAMLESSILNDVIPGA